MSFGPGDGRRAGARLTPSTRASSLRPQRPARTEPRSMWPCRGPAPQAAEAATNITSSMPNARRAPIRSLSAPSRQQQRSEHQPVAIDRPLQTRDITTEITTIEGSATLTTTASSVITKKPQHRGRQRPNRALSPSRTHVPVFGRIHPWPERISSSRFGQLPPQPVDHASTGRCSSSRSTPTSFRAGGAGGTPRPTGGYATIWRTPTWPDFPATTPGDAPGIVPCVGCRRIRRKWMGSTAGRPAGGGRRGRRRSQGGRTGRSPVRRARGPGWPFRREPGGGVRRCSSRPRSNARGRAGLGPGVLPGVARRDLRSGPRPSRFRAPRERDKWPAVGPAAG